jgi:hypothetical protein
LELRHDIKANQLCCFSFKLACLATPA